MSLRPQGLSTAPEKQGWQSWLLADALHYGPDTVQEAGNGQGIEQVFPRRRALCVTWKKPRL